MPRVRIAIVDGHDLTAAGLAHLLNESPDRFVVVDCGSQPPDVVLYDVDHEGPSRHDPDLHALLRSTPSTVIATFWDEGSPGIESALTCGAHGVLSKKLPVEQLLDGIEAILEKRSPDVAPSPHGSCHPEVAQAGLTPREVDVLGLVAAGLTNQEIADRLYLSINSVKTYIRASYQKIGAGRRSHAVIWVERHGLTPPPPAVAPDHDDVPAE